MNYIVHAFIKKFRYVPMSKKVYRNFRSLIIGISKTKAYQEQIKLDTNNRIYKFIDIQFIGI